MIYEKIHTKHHYDIRGSLFEIFSKTLSFDESPKHIYISRSIKGSIRGFHQQLDMPQKKMIFCLSGIVIDYGLNIDPLSSNFGVVQSHLLNGEACEGVMIDRSVAHAFECLSDECAMLYICDDHYDPNLSGQLNINPLDDAFSSLWEASAPKLSSKDLEGISLQEAKNVLLLKLGK